MCDMDRGCDYGHGYNVSDVCSFPNVPDYCPVTCDMCPDGTRYIQYFQFSTTTESKSCIDFLKLV